MTEVHELFAAEVRIVQFIPSGLVITRLPEPENATATKRPLPYVTENHLLAAAEVRIVHVIPSGLVITLLLTPENATATKRPLP